MNAITIRQKNTLRNRLDVTNTAVVLIGFQNDYFASNGALKKCLEPESAANLVLNNTLRLIEAL